MFYDPRNEPHGLAHNPFNSLIVPRPIGWISSLSQAGVANLAPYSFFNAVSGNPPFVMFTSQGRKDSQTNAEERGEFVVNMATDALKDALNISSSAVGSDVDEFELAGLEKANCNNVSAPRVAASPVALECIYNRTVELHSAQGQRVASDVIFGEVVGIHIADEVITDGILRIEKLRPLSRLGYMDYSVTDTVFEMPRPDLPK